MKSTQHSRNACARFGALLLTFASLVATLRAHSVWIEDTSERQLVVRFGEPGEKFEQSPGHLDSLTLPVAWSVGADGQPIALEAQKKADHFLYVGANSAQPALGETGFPVMGKEGKPGTKPFFSMRWLPAGTNSAGVPGLTLDLVPTGEPGVFRVCFRGQSLAEAKVVIHAPGEKELEVKSDAQGLVRVPVAKPGLDVATANHREQVGGFSGGKAYERTSYNASVAWRQP